MRGWFRILGFGSLYVLMGFGVYAGVKNHEELDGCRAARDAPAHLSRRATAPEAATTPAKHNGTNS